MVTTEIYHLTFKAIALRSVFTMTTIVRIFSMQI